jgi:hypothetical protein
MSDLTSSHHHHSLYYCVAVMILGQIAWIDCFVFLLFLAPQLIVQVGFFRTLIVGFKALPFLSESISDFRALWYWIFF